MKKIISCILLTLIAINLCSCTEIFNKMNFISNELSAEEIYALAAPSTVEITAESNDFTSTGTGFFYDNSGTVITNYHVIDGCYSGTITVSDGGKYDILTIIGYNKDLDIAVLSTSKKDSIPLTIRTDTINTGEKVYALGSSLGLSGTFSEGIVSSSNRIIDGYNYIQTTAPISSGNSGGPLLDKNGNVIGINTATIEDGENISLAIPILEVENVEKFYIPFTMEQIIIKTDPFEILKKYLIENGTQYKYSYMGGDYGTHTSTSSQYNDIGNTLDIGYYINSPCDDNKEAIELRLRGNKDSNNNYLGYLHFYFHPIDNTCTIQSYYTNCNGDTIAIAETNNYRTNDFPLKSDYISMDITYENGYYLSDNEEFDFMNKTAKGIEDSIHTFNAWSRSCHIGCFADDFGFQIKDYE